MAEGKNQHLGIMHCVEERTNAKIQRKTAGTGICPPHHARASCNVLGRPSVRPGPDEKTRTHETS